MPDLRNRLGRSLRSMALAGCVILWFALAPAGARAHPGHSTSAEAEWKEARDHAGAGILEVALRLPVRELELAVSRGKSQRWRLGHTEGFEDAARIYLRERFFIFRGTGEKRAGWKWIGMDAADDGGRTVWCFIELAIDTREVDPSSPWKWRNQLFVEMFKDQANSIRLRDGEKLIARDFGAKSDTEEVFGEGQDGEAK